MSSVIAVLQVFIVRGRNIGPSSRLPFVNEAQEASRVDLTARFATVLYFLR